MPNPIPAPPIKIRYFHFWTFWTVFASQAHFDISPKSCLNTVEMVHSATFFVSEAYNRMILIPRDINVLWVLFSVYLKLSSQGILSSPGFLLHCTRTTWTQPRRTQNAQAQYIFKWRRRRGKTMYFKDAKSHQRRSAIGAKKNGAHFVYLTAFLKVKKSWSTLSILDVF